MQKLKILMLISLIYFVQYAFALPTQVTPAIDAKKWVGYFKTVCGTVSDIEQNREGIFLNYNNEKDERVFYGIIWSDKENTVLNGSFDIFSVKNKKLCVSGLIDSFENIPLIIINQREQLAPIKIER